MEALAVGGGGADEGPSHEAGPGAASEDDVVRDVGKDGLPIDHQIPVADRDPGSHRHLKAEDCFFLMEEHSLHQTNTLDALSWTGGKVGARGTALYSLPAPRELEPLPHIWRRVAVSPADFCNALKKQRLHGFVTSRELYTCDLLNAGAEVEDVHAIAFSAFHLRLRDESIRDRLVGWDDDFLVVAAEGLRTGGGPALVGAQPMPKALRQPHKCG